MSAYQVDENTIYDVIHLIRKSYGSGPHYEEKQELKKMVECAPFKLFDDLVKLNIYSLKNRYGYRFSVLQIYSMFYLSIL